MTESDSVNKPQVLVLPDGRHSFQRRITRMVSMRLPSPDEQWRMLTDLRPRFVPMVNPEKTEWEEMTWKEKKAVDDLCRRYYGMLDF